LIFIQNPRILLLLNLGWQSHPQM